MTTTEIEVTITTGDIVRTKKGAHFGGYVVVVYDNLAGVPHAVVEAVAEGFEGCEHLYPLAQLERV